MVTNDLTLLNVIRWNLAEAPGLIVLERLLQLSPRVHDEWTVGRDGFADGLATEKIDLKAFGSRVLRFSCFKGEVVASGVHGELVVFDR